MLVYVGLCCSIGLLGTLPVFIRRGHHLHERQRGETELGMGR